MTKRQGNTLIKTSILVALLSFSFGASAQSDRAPVLDLPSNPIPTEFVKERIDGARSPYLVSDSVAIQAFFGIVTRMESEEDEIKSSFIAELGINELDYPILLEIVT